MNGYINTTKVTSCTEIYSFLKKIQDATKKIQWFQKTFFLEEDGLQKV